MSIEKRSKMEASLLSALAGLLIGILFMVIVGVFDSFIDAKSTWEGIRLLLFGVFSKGRDAAGNLVFGLNGVLFGNMLFKAMPLIMTGLSVALALKAGLFNIGTPGQYLMSTMSTIVIALKIPSSVCPPAVIWILALLGGMLTAAAWGAIPGAMKAYLNINEVLCCILTNWIAANLVTAVFENSDLRNLTAASKSGFLYKTSVNGVETPKLFLEKLFEGSQANMGFFIAVLFAVLVYILINRTTLGYAIRVCGANRNAARYSGIEDKKIVVLSMAIAGALAGAGASLYYLSGNTEFFWSTYQSLPSVGFSGIPAALLAQCNPVAVILSSLFMAMLEISGQQISNLTPFNQYIMSFIIAVIVYLSAFSLYLEKMIARFRKSRLFQKLKPDSEACAEKKS